MRPRGLGTFPDRDPAAHNCRILMRNGEWLTSQRPALGDPPKTLTPAEIKADKAIKGDKWLAGER